MRKGAGGKVQAERERRQIPVRKDDPLVRKRRVLRRKIVDTSAVKEKENGERNDQSAEKLPEIFAAAIFM